LIRFVTLCPRSVEGDAYDSDVCLIFLNRKFRLP
jgi:hypothetical protein